MSVKGDRAAAEPIKAEIKSSPDLPKANMHDWRGQKVGRLTILEFVGYHVTKGGNRTPLWTCQCECNSPIKTVTSQGLRGGQTLSCGCYRRETFNPAMGLIHGLSRRGVRSPIKYRWSSMNGRCHNPKNKQYHNYGGRGIIVTLEWRSGTPNAILNFYSYLKSLYPNLDELISIRNCWELDRIDNNGNYEPGNVRIVTKSVNNRNKRCTPMVEYSGEVLSISDAADKYSEFDRETVYSRYYKYGWTLHDALTKPKGNYNQAQNKEGGKVYVEYKGETLPFKEVVAKYSTLTREQVYRRCRDGWDLEEALIRPIDGAKIHVN